MPIINSNHVLAIWYFVLSTVGLVAYLLVLSAMVVFRARFADQPFYILVWYLAIGDLALLFEHYIVAIPLTFTATPLYGDGLFAMIMYGADTIIFFQIHAMNIVIALNRFCVFMAPKMYQIIFEKRNRAHLVAGLTWLVGPVWALVNGVAQCDKRFNYLFGFYHWKCADNRTEMEQMVMRGHIGYTVICPAISTVIYAALYVRLKTSKKRNDNSLETVSNESATKRERSLLVQGSLICSILLIEIALFHAADFAVNIACTYGECFFATILISGFAVVNSAVNPFIYLRFNSLIRNSVAKLLKCKTANGPDDTIANDTSTMKQNWVSKKLSRAVR